MKVGTILRRPIKACLYSADNFTHAEYLQAAADFGAGHGTAVHVSKSISQEVYRRAGTLLSAAAPDFQLHRFLRLIWTARSKVGLSTMPESTE